jgi:hypothetical protein
MSYLNNLISLCMKQLHNKVHTSDVPVTEEKIRLSTSVSTGFDSDTSFLTSFPVDRGFRKPTFDGSSISIYRNIFIAGEQLNGPTPYSGHVGTFYGIKEAAYSDHDTSDFATVTPNLRTLTHATQNFQTLGVTAGDAVIISPVGQTKGTIGGVRKVLTVLNNALTVGSDINTSTGGWVTCTVLKLNPVPLHTVTNSGSLGREQVFLTVKPGAGATSFTFTEQQKAGFSSNPESIEPYRIFPLIPPPKGNEGRADGLFNRLSDMSGTGASDLAAVEWGYRVVLYPSLADGSGPDLTKPIVKENPVVDSTIPSDEQDMLINYRDGVIYFTTPPRAGDDINPNSATGPLKLWAVYAAHSSFTASDTVLYPSLSVKSLIDLPADSMNPDYDLPSFLKYNSYRRTWLLSSGTSILDTSATTFHGFEVYHPNHVAGVANAASAIPGILWSEQTDYAGFKYWQLQSEYLADAATAIPLKFRSGNTGSLVNPRIFITQSGNTNWIEWEATALRWNIARELSIQQYTDTSAILKFRSSGSVAHGMTAISETDTYGEFKKAGSNAFGIYGLTSSNVAVKIHGYATTVDSTRTTSSVAPIYLTASKKSGTGVTDLTTTENILVVATGSTAKLILDASGTLYVDGAYQNYDDVDDAVACQDLAYTISGRYDSIFKYRQSDFEKIGVMQNGFLNLNNMFALQLGAIGEMYKILDVVCQKLGVSYSELKTLIRS